MFQKIFHETNNYPLRVIKQILKQVQHEQDQQNVNIPTAVIAEETNNNGKKQRLLLVPYKYKKGDCAIKSMKKIMKSLLPTGVLTKIAYVGNKVSTCFI